LVAADSTLGQARAPAALPAAAALAQQCYQPQVPFSNR